MFPLLVISIFSAFDLQSPQRVLWLRVVIHMKSAGGRVAEQLLPSPNQQSVFLEQHNQGKVDTGVVWPRFVSTGCGKHFSLGLRRNKKSCEGNLGNEECAYHATCQQTDFLVIKRVQAPDYCSWMSAKCAFSHTHRHLISVFHFKAVGLLWLMGVDKDASHPSDCATAGEPNLLRLRPRLKDNQDGPVRPEALHCCRLCDIWGPARRLFGHRAVPRALRGPSAHHTGVLDGRQEHEMSPRFAVAHRLIPVRRGDHRGAGRNLHSWHSVLVHRLRLHSGPPHSRPCFHSNIVQAAALQRLSGTRKQFYCRG